MRALLGLAWVGIERVTTLAILFAASMIVWSQFHSPAVRTSPRIAVPQSPISLRRAAIKGKLEAPVVLAIYSDFECPFCRRLARDVLPILERKYVESGMLQVAFFQLPIESLHPDSLAAAVATDCAAQQGRFWEIHDQLFAAPADEWKHSPLLRGEGLPPLDPKVFAACFAGSGKDRIREDVAAAKRLGFQSTPTSLVGLRNGQEMRVSEVVSGAQPVGMFEAAIDRSFNSRK